MNKPFIASIIAIHNQPLWKKCLEHLKGFCDKFYFRINVADKGHVTEKQLKEFFGDKFGAAIECTEPLDFWNWREDLLRMLDEVKPDIVVTSDSDEIFEDGFSEELLRFWESDKMMMRVHAKLPMPTIDGRIAAEGKLYPSGANCRVYKWKEGLTYDNYRGYCQVSNYADNNEITWFAEKGYHHYCFWTKEIEKIKIAHALKLYGEL